MWGVALAGETTRAPGPVEINWAALLAELDPSAYRRFRLAFDRVAGLLILLVVSSLILAIALAIVLDSGGPVFFLQRRAGRFARPFLMVKFRTMSTHAPEFSLKVAPDDPCITRVGRFLRASGMDELPNLWNVVRGEMALIGPRPEQFALLGYYKSRQHLRHLVKPGLTGWWQIHHRDSEPMHLNVDKDIYYILNQSLALDLRIIVGTMKVAASAFARRRRRKETAERGQTITRPDLAATADGSGRVD